MNDKFLIKMNIYNLCFIRLFLFVFVSKNTMYFASFYFYFILLLLSDNG